MRTVTYEQAVIKAAQNLVKIKGRFHSEQAYQRLVDAVNGLAAAPDHPATDMAAAIHYPDCWDTAAYPTLESALRELAHGFQCTNDECAHPATSGDAEDAARLDWLDATNAPFRMGWKVGAAPAGNVTVTSVIQLDQPVTCIRAAIDAAMRASKGSE